MRKLFWFLCAMILILARAEVVSALPVSFSGIFPSDKSKVVASPGVIDPSTIGYFFSESHSVTQAFQGTGLQYSNRLDLNFFIPLNQLSTNTAINWNVFVSDLKVGSWSWSKANGTGNASFSFFFDDIIGNGDYTISMIVAQTIDAGKGSIALGLNGSMTLYGNSEGSPVPEPASMLLLGIGIVGVAAMRRSLSKKEAISTNQICVT